MKLVIWVFLILVSNQATAQQFVIKGRITDKITTQPLAYTNIRIASTLAGTAATAEGVFELRMQKGNYTLILSNIGYISDTISVELKSNVSLDVRLTPIPVRLPEVTVFPGENPALEIIRRVIEAKHERNNRLNSYVFHAYTKGLVKTVKDFSSSGRSFSFSAGGGNKDSNDLKITGIIENESKGYFKKPNHYKDEIIARKQSANTPSSVNIFTGGRFLQNFYSDDIRFIDRPLLSPIADDAIDYYYYLIEDTLAMDKQNVFKIQFEPINRINPGFIGTLYVADKTYNLVKIETALNAPANPGGIFSKINIIQQFTPIKDGIPMPIDYRIIAEANPMGLFKLGFELNSIFYDYEINDSLSDDFFDMTIIKVNPDADKKDSTYWRSTQTIPNNKEELTAYKRIDSVQTTNQGFSQNFSLLSSSIPLNNNLSITGPLGLYSFNRVEGHTLNFGANVIDLFDKRSNMRLDLSYGFDDEKLKADFLGNYYLGELRTTNFSLRAYSRLVDLFSESIRYNRLTSTVVNLLGKYDFRDYYYTKGFSASLWSQVFPILAFGINFSNRTDNNASLNTDFSFFNRNKTYPLVQPITELRINSITLSTNLDVRNYMEDGYFKRRVNFGTAYTTFGGSVTVSNSNLFSSNLDFVSYRFQLSGYIPTFASARLSYIVTGQYSDGPMPYQMMYALPGNIENIGQSYTMRTLSTGEVFGDRTLVFSLEHNFNDEIFRFMHLNFLIDMQMNFSAHLNAAYVQISPKSKLLLPTDRTGMPLNVQEFKTPFAEIGFGIGQALFPFRLEFTWKLNYFGKNNFVLGLNAPLL